MRRIIMNAAALALAAAHSAEDEEIQRVAKNIEPNIRVVTNGRMLMDGNAKKAIAHLESLCVPDTEYRFIKESQKQIKPWDRKHKKNKVRW